MNLVEGISIEEYLNSNPKNKKSHEIISALFTLCDEMKILTQCNVFCGYFEFENIFYNQKNKRCKVILTGNYGIDQYFEDYDSLEFPKLYSFTVDFNETNILIAIFNIVEALKNNIFINILSLNNKYQGFQWEVYLRLYSHFEILHCEIQKEFLDKRFIYRLNREYPEIIEKISEIFFKYI